MKPFSVKISFDTQNTFFLSFSLSARDQPGSHVYIALTPNIKQMHTGMKTVISGFDETICKYFLVVQQVITCYKAYENFSSQVH